MTRKIISILAATVWIAVSEFFRNSVFLHSQWLAHYQKLGLTFPEQPVNGMVWGLWSLCFALSIFFISRRFSLLQTVFISWFAAFVLMWLSLGNLGVLPLGILTLAVPLSLLEAFLASYIICHFAKK